MPFDIETGKSKVSFSGENYGTLTADYLLEKMKQDKTVVAIVAGVPTNIGFTEEKRKQAGKQFVDVGIAEEHAVAMASGIAKNGGKPIFATHSSFMQRTYDQLSQDLCINKNPATILVNTASVYGMNDITHLGIFDILENLKENHELVITLEDGILEGGFGEKIASFYGNSNMKVKNYGIEKSFPDRFNAEELLKENGISVEQITRDIKEILKFCNGL